MAFLSNFMKADEVKALNDVQVEVAATTLKAQMFREVLHNRQVKGAVTTHVAEVIRSVAHFK
jgi:hypothetical protein